MKIIIIYDCPWESCDKPWLYNGLKKIYFDKVEMICPKQNLFKLAQKGIIGKIRRYCINMGLITKCIISTKPEDIIITWNPYVGVFLKVFGGHRIVIALNWLTPARNLFRHAKQYCFKSNEFFASVNSSVSFELWKEALNLNDTSHFFYLPDVPADENYSFNEQRGSYCFTGGVNNRDWATIVQLAKRNPSLCFVGVANKTDFYETIGFDGTDDKSLPPNLTMYFDTTFEEYYGLMRNAYVVVLPLKNDRVSGLINVIKATQYGLLTISTKIPGISDYYPKALEELQVERDIISIENAIKKLFSLSCPEYQKKVIIMQNYLKNNFSQDKAINCVSQIIARVENQI